MEELLEVLIAIAKGAITITQAKQLETHIREIAHREALKVWRRVQRREKRKLRELHDDDEDDFEEE